MTGALFLGDKAAAKDAGCNLDNHTCPDERGVQTVQRAQTLGVVNAILLFGGLALTGLGVVLVATAPTENARPVARLVVANGTLMLEARY